MFDLIYYLSYNNPSSLRIIKYDRINGFSKFEPYIYNTSLSDNYLYNNEIMLNDLIKLNNNTICFTSASKSKESLIISLISVYDYYEYIIRYYIINIFELKHLKFLFDIRTHLYNQFAAFASSFCSSSECDSNENEHFSALMIFSYPNITYNELNLI